MVIGHQVHLNKLRLKAFLVLATSPVAETTKPPNLSLSVHRRRYKCVIHHRTRLIPTFFISLEEVRNMAKITGTSPVAPEESGSCSSSPSTLQQVGKIIVFTCCLCCGTHRLCLNSASSSFQNTAWDTATGFIPS